MDIQTVEIHSSSASEHGSKHTIPMQLDYDHLQLTDKEDAGKLRRPVRPVDRQRMRPWLMELLDTGNVYGLNWTNRYQGVFQISWRHASRLGWNLETDGDVFERWARHTGIYKEGDPPEPKRWKANFRCALHSLHDVVELTTALERRGRNACRTYRFLHSSEERVLKKRSKTRSAQSKELELYERPRDEELVQEVVETDPAPVYEFVTTEIVSSDMLDMASGSESDEELRQEKVIVQKVEMRPELAEEELGLHHDHDYSVLQEKSQKTIVLRQGIGSIVLHKEVFNDGTVQQEEKKLSSSNLDQLASAAVSTAGWNTVLAPGLESSSSSGERSKNVKQRIKTKLTAKELAASGLLRVESERAAYNLRYLLTGESEDALAVASISGESGQKSSKKRRLESAPEQHHPSISVGAEETVGTESTVGEEMGEMVPYIPTKVTKSPRRTASPRILSGAKARRQRSKSEKTDSESTEPLMSSCLLLLEAATRLDNAEKDSGSPGVRTRGRGRNSARTTAMNLPTKGGRRGTTSNTKLASVSDDESESSNLAQGEDAIIINADQDLHMVLRKTLESLKNRTAKVIEQQHEEEAAPEIVLEPEEAQGLFSGSKIRAADPGVQAGQGQEYVEMVVQEDDSGIAYIEGESMPGEIIIESVPSGGEEEKAVEAAVSRNTAFIHHIPAGSVLLQTGDGTPIGILDAEGKLTAFQSAEARSAISMLMSVEGETSPADDVGVNEGGTVTFQLSSDDLEHINVKLEAQEEEAVSDVAQVSTAIDTAAVKVERLEESDYSVLVEQVNNTQDDQPDLVPLSCMSSSCIMQSLLKDLPTPFSLEEIFANLNKILESQAATSCSCVFDGSEDSVSLNSPGLKRLEDLCKLHFIRLCFSLKETNSAALNDSVSVASSATKTSKARKIKILPTPWSTMQLASKGGMSSNGRAESQCSGQTSLDPTAPLSLGEIPLFATAKESESHSPPSE